MINKSKRPSGSTAAQTDADAAPSFKSRGGAGRLLNALRYSWRGLAFAFRHEAAFRQELLACVILVPLAFYIAPTPGQLLLLLGSLVLVLVAELFNSAIEAVADAITLDYNPLIGRAKDLGSAAVFLCLLLCAACWVVVGCGLFG